MLDDNIFTNPVIQAAKEALSKEDKERYAKLGKELFKNIDFEKCTVDNMPPSLEDSINYIDSMIKSGLHPSMLNDDEKFLMKDVLGNEWYKKYGYIEEDLDDIVTLKLN